jgi:hypothetical protein
MLVASFRIRRQLARTPGCIRWASVIAGPREFWTITVWQTRDGMLAFMRSGAHEDIMWLFGKWLRSFWLSRWRPTNQERGSWKGMRFSAGPALSAAPLASTPEGREALAAALESIPHLKSSVAPTGAPTYDYSQMARRRRRAVAGGEGMVIRLEVPHVWQVPRAWRDIRSLNRRLQEDPDVLRWVVGLARPRELYALAVLRDDRICARFLGLPQQAALAERWGAGYWAMRWQPDNEFGHWDGLRLRKERLGTAIRVPDRAARAARSPSVPWPGRKST